MAGRDRVPTTQSLRRDRAGRCLLQPIARARQSVATAASRSNSNRLSAICYRPFHGALCHSLLLWCLQALFESSCEIDHLGGRRSFGRSLDFLALGFRIDHFLDLLSVGVLVFLLIELIGQSLNQLERTIYLSLRDFLLFLD